MVRMGVKFKLSNGLRSDDFGGTNNDADDDFPDSNKYVFSPSVVFTADKCKLNRSLLFSVVGVPGAGSGFMIPFMF